jgi:hypothetical protein
LNIDHSTSSEEKFFATDALDLPNSWIDDFKVTFIEEVSLIQHVLTGDLLW